MKQRRDVFILAGLFVALVIFLAISPRLRPPEIDRSEPTARSSDANGTMALFRWLDQMGYEPQRLEYRSFVLDDADSALLVFNPSEPIFQDDADEMLRWVDAGGTLIFADDAPIMFGSSNALLETLDVSFETYTETQALELPIINAEPRQPVFTEPNATAIKANTGRYIAAPNRPDLVTLAGTIDAPVVAGLKHGRGYIYLSTATFPFTNQGLREAGNAAMMLNMLRRVPPGGRIQFDEYHLGYFEPPSTTSLVLGSPLGWATAYALLIVGAFLLLSGRRFGTPIPLRSETARRSSAEYVTSMADLFRRGGKRQYIARHYATALRRRLARRYGLSPQLEDAALAAEIARVHPADEATLVRVLTQLRNARSDEALIKALAEAEHCERALV